MQTEREVKSTSEWRWMKPIAIIGLIGVFVWSLFFVIGEKTFFYDVWIQGIVSIIATEGVRGFFELFTILGDKQGVIPILIISLLLIWWKKKDYLGMAVLTVGVIVVNELNKFIKDTTGRERPMTGPGAESLSFPSGHAMVGLFFYGLLTYLIVQYTKGKISSSVIVTIGALFIFLLGFSRLILNYHYPSDVIAGYAAGTLSLLAATTIYHSLQVKFTKRK
ncbi:phosphatase PAP2 family protein [Sutcliffiella cohnii]|uniref:phosphatase PAP2 family protein n=1 Tax=Sutcliffiella TaxID=2837511 RepID=UPI0022DDF3A1|nr:MULTISPECIES: phosphatase PAP2 family protein [Sutcliffiella]MED4017384.1 phosphatase PAP2 family protein [Sutcliffiella cohnii]WBL16149.1 phosphatase PAP2 family protein [Sutcliffiella sp. NC1]